MPEAIEPVDERSQEHATGLKAWTHLDLERTHPGDDPMPLSDEEARLLHQLEQSLAADDPDFASTLRGSKLLAQSKRVATLSIVGFITGIGLLFGGVVMARTWLGVAGFLVMLGAVYVFVTAGRTGFGASAERVRTSAAPKPSGSFVDRMEERWHRRQQGDDR
jgi:hypothetical protein